MKRINRALWHSQICWDPLVEALVLSCVLSPIPGLLKRCRCICGNPYLSTDIRTYNGLTRCLHTKIKGSKLSISCNAWAESILGGRPLLTFYFLLHRYQTTPVQILFVNTKANRMMHTQHVIWFVEVLDSNNYRDPCLLLNDIFAYARPNKHYAV